MELVDRFAEIYYPPDVRPDYFDDEVIIASIRRDFTGARDASPFPYHNSNYYYCLDSNTVGSYDELSDIDGMKFDPTLRIAFTESRKDRRHRMCDIFQRYVVTYGVTGPGNDDLGRICQALQEITDRKLPLDTLFDCSLNVDWHERRRCPCCRARNK